jgi:hypothetical protein
MIMSTKKRVIIWLIGWTLLYLVFCQLLPYLSNKYHGCYIHQDIYNRSIKSVVLDKFIDPANHNEKTIIYFGKDGKQEKMIFTPELLGVYDFLNEGDSLIKEKNSIYYRVRYKATGKDTVIKFETTCKDSLAKSR